MKLYATITSERATKGQGGNQFINIDLLIGDAKNPIDAGRVSMKTTGDVFWIDYFAPHKPGKRSSAWHYSSTRKAKSKKAMIIRKTVFFIKLLMIIKSQKAKGRYFKRGKYRFFCLNS